VQTSAQNFRPLGRLTAKQIPWCFAPLKVSKLVTKKKKLAGRLLLDAQTVRASQHRQREERRPVAVNHNCDMAPKKAQASAAAAALAAVSMGANRSGDVPGSDVVHGWHVEYAKLGQLKKTSASECRGTRSRSFSHAPVRGRRSWRGTTERPPRSPRCGRCRINVDQDIDERQVGDDQCLPPISSSEQASFT